MWNVDCRASNFKGYTEQDKRELLATTETIYWPLSGKWTTDLVKMLENGEPTFELADDVSVQEPAVIELVETDES